MYDFKCAAELYILTPVELYNIMINSMEWRLLVQNPDLLGPKEFNLSFKDCVVNEIDSFSKQEWAFLWLSMGTDFWSGNI